MNETGIFLIIAWLVIMNMGLIVICYRHQQEIDKFYTHFVRFSNLVEDFLERISKLSDRVRELERKES